MALPPASAQTHTLAKEHELRIEAGAKGVTYLRLRSGTAEIFGVELAPERTLSLSGSRKLALFTWMGCEVQVWGAECAMYVSKESQVPLFANLHQQLEARRSAAEASGGQGPRVLVVGPTDSGKSTLCRILLSYACRVGRAPTFVDLDLGQGEVSVPGTVAATPLDRQCLSSEEGYTGTAPLSYYVGEVSPGTSPLVYRNAAERLAELVGRRQAQAGDIGDRARVGGLVINTFGWVDGLGYELLLHAARTFAVDTVVVMGHDRTFAQMSEDLKAPSAGGGAASAAAAAAAAAPITLLKLNRSGGVVERSKDFRRDARAMRVRQYFYGGDPQAPLTPETLSVRFEDVVLVRVGGVVGDSTLIPIGKASALDPLRITIVPPTERVINQLLAVSYATTDKQIPHVNVAGFVHVRAVDAKERKITLLAPCAGELPSKFLILGAMTWVDV